MRKLPVYDIERFEANVKKNDLYVNTFQNHLIKHSFIETSHSHNFYLLVLFTQGYGMHKIDVLEYEICKGSLYMIKPGQVHSWQLSNDIDGYILFYSKEIYNLYFGHKNIEDYPFYNPQNTISEIKLNQEDLIAMKEYFDLLVKESQTNKSKKIDKLLNLIDIIHIEISRKFLSENTISYKSYQHKLMVFNELLDRYYKTQKSTSFYANEMNITSKHLNRICREVLNKTTTELISQKLVLESKRLLTFTQHLNISEIANMLGYENDSYFSRFFKKNTGQTPSEFRKSLMNL